MPQCRSCVFSTKRYDWARRVHPRLRPQQSSSKFSRMTPCLPCPPSQRTTANSTRSAHGPIINAPSLYHSRSAIHNTHVDDTGGATKSLLMVSAQWLLSRAPLRTSGYGYALKPNVRPLIRYGVLSLMLYELAPRVPHNLQ